MHFWNPKILRMPYEMPYRLGEIRIRLGLLQVVVITVASSVFFEWIYDKLMHKKNTITDFSAVVTGLLLALNMPASIPLWMPVLGSAFAIIVVKQLFGGLGQNFMNPALAGRCFLMISFAGKMTDFAVSDSFRGVVDTVSGATYSSKGLIQAVKNALEEARRVTNGETDDDNNVVQLNTEEVEKAIDAVNELNGSDYTSASWAVVKVRLKDARKALKNATEQTQLDEAAAELNQAVKELRISDGSNEAPEPDVPESTYIDGEYPVTVLCLPDEDMDFVAYNLFSTVTIRDDEIVGITNIYGDGGSDNDSYIRRAINGTSSKAGVVDQIIKKGNLDGIDTVSRATCTSQAIIDACQQALNNAKRQ